VKHAHIRLASICGLIKAQHYSVGQRVSTHFMFVDLDARTSPCQLVFALKMVTTGLEGDGAHRKWMRRV
jgi:hypothetical protein